MKELRMAAFTNPEPWEKVPSRSIPVLSVMYACGCVLLLPPDEVKEQGVVAFRVCDQHRAAAAEYVTAGPGLTAPSGE